MGNIKPKTVEIEQPIRITKDEFQTGLAYSREFMNDSAKWDEFVDAVYNAAFHNLEAEIYINAIHDESITTDQINAVNGIKRNLKALKEEMVITELWESLCDDALTGDDQRNECLYKHQSLIDACECWLSVTGDKDYRTKFWPRALLEDLMLIVPIYTSINISAGNEAPFITYCYKVFLLCYKQTYSRDQLRTWVKAIMKQKKVASE